MCVCVLVFLLDPFPPRSRWNTAKCGEVMAAPKFERHAWTGLYSAVLIPTHTQKTSENAPVRLGCGIRDLGGQAEDEVQWFSSSCRVSFAGWRV